MEILSVTSVTQSEYPAKPKPKGTVGQIREIHHRVARLYAKGLKYTEIAAIVNRTPPTIKNWLASPANQELVAHYEGLEEAEVTSEAEYRLELRKRAATMALEKLVEKLEADQIDADRTLLAIVADSDDRTGLGRQETRVNLNVGIAAQLEQRMARANSLMDRRSAKVIELRPKAEVSPVGLPKPGGIRRI